MTSAETFEAVGQIGLGTLGSIFAGHLMAAGKRLTAFDADPDRLNDTVAKGARSGQSPAQVAAASEAVVLSLPNPEAARACFFQSDGILAGSRSGLLVIDLSTIDPWTAREFDKAAKAKAVDYVEAPISGGEPGGAGTDGARAANVSFMVGGELSAFERAKPIMSILGKRFFHLGPAGRGSTVKLISNHIAGLHNLVAAEAFVLGAAAGIAPETLLEVFDGTDAKSFWLTEYFAPRIGRRDFAPGFSVDLQYKDHRLAEDLGRALKVPLPLNALAIQVYQMLRAHGDGGKDLVEAVNFLAQLADTDIYAPARKADVP